MTMPRMTEQELAEAHRRVRISRMKKERVMGQQGKHLLLPGANDGPVPNETGNAVRVPRMARNKGMAPVSLRGESVEVLNGAGRGEAYSPEAGQAIPLRTKESERRTNAGGRPAPSPSFSPFQLTLTGQLPSGKNQVQLLFRNGKVHKYPNKTFTHWREASMAQITSEFFRAPNIAQPICLTVNYWPGDARTRDVSGQLDALFHLLVYAKVLKDDGLIYSVWWRRHEMSRQFPKVSMELEAWHV